MYIYTPTFPLLFCLCVTLFSYGLSTTTGYTLKVIKAPVTHRGLWMISKSNERTHNYMYVILHVHVHVAQRTLMHKQYDRVSTHNIRQILSGSCCTCNMKNYHCMHPSQLSLKYLQSLCFAVDARSGLLTWVGELTAGSSFNMSGMIANLDGGVLVYGELRISSKNFRSYMMRVPTHRHEWNGQPSFGEECKHIHVCSSIPQFLMIIFTCKEMILWLMLLCTSHITEHFRMSLIAYQ